MQFQNDQLQVHRDQLKASTRALDTVHMSLNDNSQSKNGTCSAKLPKLSIQPFYGDILRWPEFWDVYNIRPYM